MSKFKNSTIKIVKKSYKNIVDKSYDLLKDICSLIDKKLKNKELCEYINSKINIRDVKSIHFDDFILEINNESEKISINFIPNIYETKQITINYLTKNFRERKSIAFENNKINVEEMRLSLKGQSKEQVTIKRIFKNNILTYKKMNVMNIVNDKMFYTLHEAFISDDIIASKKTEIYPDNKTITRFYTDKVDSVATFYDDRKIPNNNILEQFLFLYIEQDKCLCRKEEFERNKNYAIKKGGKYYLNNAKKLMLSKNFYVVENMS